MKYNLEFKLARVKEYLNRETVYCPPGLNKISYMNHVRNWVYIFNNQGIDGLKHSITNKLWTAEQKMDLISKILAGQSISSVARDNFINIGQLYSWLKKYRENGYDGLKLCHKGRKPKVIKMTNKTTPPKITQSEYEELKLLRERNLYLEAENIYLKKLRALELKKEAAQAKAKKQK